MPLQFNLTTEEKVTGVTFSPTKKNGQPAQLDGRPTVTVESGNGTFDDAGGDLPEFLSGDTSDTTVFRITGDADLGAGVVEISDTVTLIASDPLAENLGLGGGSVVAK
jgi:hypothetical protein